MFRVISIVLIFITLLSARTAEEDSLVMDSLKQLMEQVDIPNDSSIYFYKLNRDQIANSAKSEIADLLKAGRNDEVRKRINYVDSLTAPDSSWLRPNQRFVLRSLLEGSQFFTDPLVYVEYLDFDTIHVNSYCDPCAPTPPKLSSRAYTVSDAYLNTYLTTEFTKLFPLWLEELKLSNPEVYEFMMIFDSPIGCEQGRIKNCRDPEEINKNKHATEFLKTYKNSVFSKIVFHNYYREREGTGTGILLGIGGGVFTVMNSDIGLNTSGNMNVYLELFAVRFALKAGVLITGYMDISSPMSTEIENEPLPVGSEILLVAPHISLGYLFEPRRELMITPYIGFVSLMPDYPAKPEDDVDFHSMPGVQIGVSTDINIRGFTNPYVKSDRHWRGAGWRIDMGCMINSLDSYPEDGALFSIYGNLSINMYAFGSRRVQDRPEWH